MSVKRRLFAGVALALFGLLPRLAAGQGSIGPLQHLLSFRGFRGTSVTAFTRAGSLAYFTVQGPYTFESLWRSDGTLPGTFELSLTAPNEGFQSLRFWTAQGSRIFFTRPRTLDLGELNRDLWRSDGTVAGTVPLTHGLSFAVDGAESPPTALAVPETGLVFFSAGEESEWPDYELWVTDGTAEGTRFVEDVNPEGPSNPGFMTTLGGRLFFLADTPQGRELWRSDGTPEGTERIVSLHPHDQGFARLARVGDSLFLPVQTDAGVVLWRSDGTEAGTSKVLELPGAKLGRYAAAGRRLFLTIMDSSLVELELWAVDGDSGESVRVLQAREPVAVDLVAFGDNAVFALSEAGYGKEPWLSDGTPEGTRRIADICPGPCDSSPALYGTYAGRFLFLANDGSGRDPWTTDGTTSGTHRVGDLCPGDCSILGVQEINGWLVLTTGEYRNYEIWMSDGSEDGAFEVAAALAVPITNVFPVSDQLLIATESPAGEADLLSLPVTAPAPPAGDWLESPNVPGFRFQVWIDGQLPGRQEPACIARSLCVSGSQAGRSEVFLRMSEPRPDGRLWPAVVKLTTAAVEVWALQPATGRLRYYRLDATDPAGSTLEGILDRGGFPTVPGAVGEAAVGEAKAARPPQPPGRWIQSPTVPGFRVQARLTSGGKKRILGKVPCMAETFCLGTNQTELLVRVADLKPALARFTTATVEVWIQQRKTGKVRYYRLPAAPNGSSDLDGYFDREGFKP